MEEKLKFAEEVPGYYSRAELTRLYELAMECEPGSTLVEIGCQYGRSTSMLFYAAREKGHCVEVIDNFCVDGERAREHFFELTEEFDDVLWALYELDACDMAKRYNREIDLLHIDGNHAIDGIERDILNYEPKVKPGGVIVCHDYDTRDSSELHLVFPGISEMCNKYLGEWKKEVNDSQGIFWKP